MAAMMPVPDTNNHNTDSPNYKQKYRTLKRKLKFLLYEQEYFQEELRKVQKKLLRVSRDKSFLLDRLLQYETVEHSSSDEDSTASSSNSDTEGQKMIMTETTYSNSRSKKPQAATLHNHTMHSEGFGLFPYASPSGSAESGGNTGPEPGSNLVQCKFSSNAKQCQELVSKRSKSGYCTSHRTMVRISKQSMSLTPKISQPHIADEVSRQDELVVDQQLERLQELAEPAMAQHVSQASEQVPQEMFSVDEDDRESENEDSPASAGFHGNVYEGDDDLVIDLPE